MRGIRHPLLRAGLLCAALLMAVAPIRSEAPAPLDELKAQVDRILDIMDKVKDTAARHQKLSDIYHEVFDAVAMAQTTLKSDWKKLKDPEREVFSKKFADFVFSFYMSKLENYEKKSEGGLARPKIEYEGAEMKSDTRSVVKTAVDYKGTPAKIFYSMRLKDGHWRIYDVEVEGIRLSSQYRSQFHTVLVRNGFKGLELELDRLSAKSPEELEKENPVEVKKDVVDNKGEDL